MLPSCEQTIVRSKQTSPMPINAAARHPITMFRIFFELSGGGVVGTGGIGGREGSLNGGSRGSSFIETSFQRLYAIGPHTIIRTRKTNPITETNPAKIPRHPWKKTETNAATAPRQNGTPF
jgi:hypothetical protein